MAEGISTDGANVALDAIVDWFSYVQLHVGAPGAAGTANMAVESTRKYCSAFDPAAGAATSNAVDLEWFNVAGNEDYTHFSLWDSDVDGMFGGSGTITADPVTAGDDFTIFVGDLDLSLSPLAS